MIRTSHSLSLKGINLSLFDEAVKSTEGSNQDALTFDSDAIRLFNICSFPNRSEVSPSGAVSQNITDLFYYFFNDFPDITNSDSPFVGYDTVQEAMYSVSKAMLIALLDGNSKRTSGLSTSSLADKKEIFYNVLADTIHKSESDTKDYTIKPWSNWYSIDSTVNPISIARSDNIAIVTTDSPHGISTSFDDWSIIMNLNTPGISSSFNISTSTYPNGVPIKIIDDVTFSYSSVGSTVGITTVSGTANVCTGWGGQSNNLHIVCTFPA